MLLHKDKADFINLCQTVVTEIGKESDLIILGKELKGKTYEDEVVVISLSDDGREMEVKRKLTDHSLLYVQDEEVIYFHGNFIYLVDHVTSLINKTTKTS